MEKEMADTIFPLTTPCPRVSWVSNGPLKKRSVWHILDVYAILAMRGRTMQRKARIFMNNRNQAVRLPKDFQFDTKEVFIRKVGTEVVLSPRPLSWSSYLAEGPVASASFMENVQDLPVQEREP
jgi:antitoxin VapB